MKGECAMATWDALKSYIRSTYKVAEERPDMVKLVFETGELRSQIVLLWHMTLAGNSEEWVQIESPSGELESINLTHALKEIQDTVCGGLAMAGDNLVTF